VGLFSTQNIQNSNFQDLYNGNTFEPFHLKLGFYYGVELSMGINISESMYIAPPLLGTENQSDNTTLRINIPDHNIQ
jgi:hypothetical protein